MLSPTSICISTRHPRPIITIINKLNRHNIKPHKCMNSRLDLCKKFVFSSGVIFIHKTKICGKIRNQLNDEMESLEQEGLIDKSTRGQEATLNSLSKWAVATLFGAIILWRHDPEALWAALGSILNAGLSVILKRILNQERPVSSSKSDPGMPSSHAQSIFFTSIFVIMSMVEYFELNELTASLSAVILAIGSYFSWLRVSQKLHTISQVTVGAILGSIFSFLWFWSWKAIVLDAFESSLSVRIIVLLSAAVMCLGFSIYVIQYWIMDEKER
ncbi:protein modifying enzyme [Lithospermum erythrorhizon]|uniref:Protein modifying enzyme n=1 Tax=Lithospermum erythrorhizon TaxID=34254 RepID=A0AAV3QL03_LITER